MADWRASPNVGVTMPSMDWYSFTKHALDATAGGLRMGMKDFGVDVSILEPGCVDTPFSTPAMETLDKAEKNPLDPVYGKQMAALRLNFPKAVNEDGTKVSSITKLVVKDVETSNPRRYYTVSQAKLAKFLKRWFGYGLLDNFMITTTIRHKSVE